MAEEIKKKAVDKFVDFLFKRKNFYLILILLLAFALRITAASNTGAIADEMNVAVRSIDIHKSGTFNSIDESHSFYYLNEIFYKIFGISLLTARLTSVLFGVLSILLIYLIVMKLYKNEKIALVACFLAAISGFQIRFSLAEMDITMAFFVLLSSYAFLLAIYDKKDKMYYLSALFLGLAIAIKTFAGIWILTYFSFFIYHSYKNKEYRKEHFGRKIAKIALICGLIVLISIIPIIIANYLLYKDKGIVDFQISRFLNINKEYYAGLGGIESPFMISQLSTGLKTGFDAFRNWDALISILAILGFLMTFKKYKEANLFLFLWFIFVFLFIAGTAWLDTHFVFNTLIFSVFAALFLVKADESFIRKFNFKHFLTASLIIIFIFNIWAISPYITSKTAINKMRSYAVNEIGANDLVIVDQRVFRGRTALIFNDKAYIESENLNQMLQNMQPLQENPSLIKTIFIECVPDDCGWGTIKNQPELNASVEGMLSFFSNITQERKIIYGGGGNDEAKGEPHFQIYTTYLNFKPSIINYAKQAHYFFLYPVGWQGEIYDKYQIYNDLDNLLNKFGFLIFYITIILEVISPFIIIWFLKQSRKNEVL